VEFFSVLLRVCSCHSCNEEAQRDEELGRLNKLNTNIYVENRASCSGKAPHLCGITITVRTQNMLSIFVVFLSHLKRIPQW